MMTDGHRYIRTYIYPPLDKRYSPIISSICGPNNILLVIPREYYLVYQGMYSFLNKFFHSNSDFSLITFINFQVYWKRCIWFSSAIYLWSSLPPKIYSKSNKPALLKKAELYQSTIVKMLKTLKTEPSNDLSIVYS